MGFSHALDTQRNVLLGPQRQKRKNRALLPPHSSIPTLRRAVPTSQATGSSPDAPTARASPRLTPTKSAHMPSLSGHCFLSGRWALLPLVSHFLLLSASFLLLPHLSPPASPPIRAGAGVREVLVSLG